MSTKDFKQGMVAGAKPFGDKLDQLANVSESAISDIKDGIDGVNEVVNIILDDLSTQEKKRIYDLDEATDISNLEDDEKEFLVAVLAELANSVPYVTDLQRKYIISVCSTVGIAAPQVSLNLACIENVENMKTQKILLRHVMEFFYIGCQDYEFLDEYDDLIFCYFSVNKRGINEIITTIDRIYNAMGIEGLANRYTFVAGYEELVEEEASEEEINSEDSIGEEIIDPSLYEKIELSGIISVQDPTEYKHKNIKISAAFSAVSDLVFKNCIVQITPSASFNVSGSLTFEKCEITCESERTKESFIISALENSKIVLNDSVFMHISWLAQAQCSDVEIDKCTFDGCSNILKMGDNQIHRFSITDTYISVGNGLNLLFDIQYCNEFKAINICSSWNVENNENEYYGLFEISAENCVISNCEFKNAYINCSYYNGLMDKCTLYDCDVSIRNITNCLVENSFLNKYCIDSTINKCNFQNVVEKQIRAKSIVNSIFDKLECSSDFIKFETSIDNCIFSNVNMKAGAHLIRAKISYGLGDKKQEAYISNCRFINCYTERSDRKLIVGTETKHTLFSDKEFPYDAKLVNCAGLSDVKGGTFIEEKIQNNQQISVGAKISAGLGATFGGTLGAIGGATLGGIIDKIKSK